MNDEAISVLKKMRLLRSLRSLAMTSCECLLALFFLVSCAKSRESLDNALYVSNRPVYKVGVIFLNNIPDSIKKKILSIKKINQISLIEEQAIRQKLHVAEVNIDELFTAEDIGFYNDFGQSDFLIVAKKEGAIVSIQFVDFLKKSLKYFNWEKLDVGNEKWILETKSGFMIVDASKKDVEVSINYRLVGYTPYFIHLLDGDYSVTLSKDGYTLHSEKILIPKNGEIYLDKIKIPHDNKDEFEMERSDKIQAYFMVTLFIALAAMGIIFPTLLL